MEDFLFIFIFIIFMVKIYHKQNVVVIVVRYGVRTEESKIFAGEKEEENRDIYV